MTQAVRHGVDPEHPEYLQTLANLRTRISDTTADDGVDRADNVSGLSKIYQDMGAYGDLMPEDGDRGTFKPSPPLPVQECSESRSVEREGRLLVRDCSVLLDLKDTLKGTATLNWSKDTALSRWTGITTGGTPQRVTGLSLASSNLNGSIPTGLERLSALTTVDLSGNSLTGTVPMFLVRLPLDTVRISGNSLSGCIPAALRDVTTHDLASVGLSYCDRLTAPPAPSGLRLSVADGVFTISWNEVSRATKYEAQHRIGDATDWTALPAVETTSTTHAAEGGLTCGTAYRFRVRAFGDGVMDSADWGDPSTEASHTTGACN